MDLREYIQEYKRNYYLFDPKEYGKIFVFVDFSNVRHWAKYFWSDENKEYFKKEIDIGKIAEVCNWINPERKFFYYGHYKMDYPESKLGVNDPRNLKYRQSIYRIDKAKKAGFTPRTKDIKEIDNFDYEGKFLGKIRKCNFDVEITMDILLKINKYDTVFLWSGDSDFDRLLQYLKSKGKKSVTICARRFASDELRINSSLFILADPLKNYLEYIPNKNTPPQKGAEV